MTYRELYQSALRMVSESDGEGLHADYEERAGYLLAAFCNECASIEKRYCEANDLTRAGFSPQSVIALDDRFPLQDAFVPAAIYYLSAMLVIDENEDLSDRFFELYTDSISTIQAGIPCVKHRIVNEYSNLI